MLEGDACLTVGDTLKEIVCVVIGSGSIREIAMIAGVEFNGIGVGVNGLLVIFGSKSSIALLFPIFSRFLNVHLA